MQKTRVAVIGAGTLANNMHYPSLASFEDVQIVGLCDLDPERLNATAERFQVSQKFSDYKQMLDKLAPDAVFAIMPPHVLFEVAMEVLQRGHNLFIEKPPGVTTFQAACLARTAEKKGLVTAVGFQRRYHPMLLRCYEEVKKHGDIHQVASSFFKNMAPQENHPYYRGAIDMLHCDAIHAIDALRFYAGLAEVRTLCSSARNLDCWYGASYNALLTFKNDVVGLLQVNWRSGKRLLKLELHGYGAASFADIDSEGVVWADDKAQPLMRLTPQEEAGGSPEYICQGFLAENRAFIDAVQKSAQVHNNLQDSVKSMELADLIVAGQNIA